MRSIVHAIRNHLAVAVANVEAFRDGVLEPTPARLNAVLRALTEAEVLLQSLPRAPVPSEDLVTGEVLAFEGAAREKGLALRVRRPGGERLPTDVDPVRAAEIINSVVSTAIRYAPAGGTIEVDCAPPDAFLDVTVDRTAASVGPGEIGLGVVRQFVEARGGTVEIGAGEGDRMRLSVRL